MSYDSPGGRFMRKAAKIVIILYLAGSAIFTGVYILQRWLG